MTEVRKSKRSHLIRKVVVFQFKLLLDALRDLSLSPLSLLAAGADFLGLSPHQGTWFDRVLALGRRTEHWIDLWRGGDQARGEVDVMVNRLEHLLRDEDARRAAPLKLRQWAERTLQQMQAGEPPGPPPTPPPGPSAS